MAETLTLKLLGGDLGAKVHDAHTRNSQPLTDAATAHFKAATKWDAIADKIAAKLAANDYPSLQQFAVTPTAYDPTSSGASRIGIGNTVGDFGALLRLKGGKTGAQIGGTLGGLTGNPLIAAAPLSSAA